MATAELAFMTLIIIIGLIETFSNPCDNHFSLTGPEMAALINRTYPSCDQRNLSRELPICQVEGENTVDTCYAPPDKLTAPSVCPDGTWKRTYRSVVISEKLTGTIG